MVRYEKSAKRKRYEELIRKGQELDEREKQIERQAKELEERQKHPLGDYPIGRRPALKKIGLAVGGLVLGTSILGVISYLSSPKQYTPPETVPIETPKETYQETPVKQVQTTEQKTTNPMDDPDNWPRRLTLSDLRNAQFETGSFSQYVAPEYNSEKCAIVDSNCTDAIPSEYWIKMTREELMRLGEYDSHSEAKEWSDGEIAVYILNQNGEYYFKAPFRYKWLGKAWMRFGDLTPDLILYILEPDDKTDQAMFRNESGTFKTFAKG